MTKPTTAECIIHIDNEIPEYGGHTKDVLEAIRAQLIAAQGMAKALEEYLWYRGDKVNEGSAKANVQQTLAAWRACGGAE